MVIMKLSEYRKYDYQTLKWTMIIRLMLRVDSMINNADMTHVVNTELSDRQHL
jgi:hypothetical protein